MGSQLYLYRGIYMYRRIHAYQISAICMQIGARQQHGRILHKHAVHLHESIGDRNKAQEYNHAISSHLQYKLECTFLIRVVNERFLVAHTYNEANRTYKFPSLLHQMPGPCTCARTLRMIVCTVNFT